MKPFELILTVLGSAGGAGVIIAGLSAWLGKVWASRIADAHMQALKFAATIDLDLRKRRIEVYKRVWKETGLLPKWPEAEGVSYEKLWRLSEWLRDWYFDEGGMYLSRTTHNNGFAPLQDAIADLRKQNHTGEITPEHYKLIRSKCSALRTAMALDIESRRESPL